MATIAIGTTVANISWAPPEAELQNGIVTQYTVMLTDLMFGMPSSLYNTTLTSFSLTGLEEYARYSYEVAASTAGGQGPFSAPVQFTTLEECKFFYTYVDANQVSVTLVDLQF